MNDAKVMRISMCGKDHYFGSVVSGPWEKLDLEWRKVE